MKVSHVGTEVGITEIFTADKPSPDITPPKRPYIIFKVPFSEANRQFLSNSLLAKLCTRYFDYQNKAYTLVITSDRKVIKAIEAFFQESQRYPEALNQNLYQQLNALKAECEQRLKQKPSQKLPLHAKKSVDYEVKGAPIEKSANVTQQVVKKKSPQKKFIHKTNPSERAISEIEAFNGYCYRLLLGDRAPKVRVLYNEQGQRAGLISEEIPSFQSYSEKYELFFKGKPLHQERYKPTNEELLKSEIVKVWVAAYTEEEDDLHTGNYGIGPDGFTVKIDNDRSTWPLVSKYSNEDPTLERKHFAKPAPAAAFPIAEADILGLPYLQHANPYHVPGRSDYGLMAPSVELILDEKFNEDKYYMFLKRILIPKSAFKSIADATISSDKKKKEFTDHKNNRTKKLKSVLVKMPEFQDYVLNHPKAIDQIVKEFEEYNKDYKKGKDAYLRINTSDIKKDFAALKLELTETKEIQALKKQEAIRKLAASLNAKQSDNWKADFTQEELDLFKSVNRSTDFASLLKQLSSSTQSNLLDNINPVFPSRLITRIEDLLAISNSITKDGQHTTKIRKIISFIHGNYINNILTKSTNSTQELRSLASSLSQLPLEEKIKLLKQHRDTTIHHYSLADELITLIAEDVKTMDVNPTANYHFKDILTMPNDFVFKFFRAMSPATVIKNLARLNHAEIYEFFKRATDDQLSAVISFSMEPLIALLRLAEPKGQSYLLSKIGREVNDRIKTPKDLFDLLGVAINDPQGRGIYMNELLKHLDRKTIEKHLNTPEVCKLLKDIYFLYKHNSEVGDKFIKLFGGDAIVKVAKSDKELHKLIMQLPEDQLASSLPSLFGRYADKTELKRLVLEAPRIATAIGDYKDSRSLLLNHFEDIEVRKLMHEIFSVSSLRQIINEYKGATWLTQQQKDMLSAFNTSLSRTLSNATNPISSYPNALRDFKGMWENTIYRQAFSGSEAKEFVSKIDPIISNSVLTISMFRRPPAVDQTKVRKVTPDQSPSTNPKK